VKCLGTLSRKTLSFFYCLHRHKNNIYNSYCKAKMPVLQVHGNFFSFHCPSTSRILSPCMLFGQTNISLYIKKTPLTCGTKRRFSYMWSWWTDLNPRPADYKSAALPAELHQHHGGSNRARTYDPLLVRQMLSQLSYAPTTCR
jgi:hypothetical protein